MMENNEDIRQCRKYTESNWLMTRVQYQNTLFILADLKGHIICQACAQKSAKCSLCGSIEVTFIPNPAADKIRELFVQKWSEDELPAYKQSPKEEPDTKCTWRPWMKKRCDCQPPIKRGRDMPIISSDDEEEMPPLEGENDDKGTDVKINESSKEAVSPKKEGKKDEDVRYLPQDPITTLLSCTLDGQNIVTDMICLFDKVFKI